MKIQYPRFKNSYKSTLKKFETGADNDYLKYLSTFLVENETCNIQKLLKHLYHYEFTIKEFYKLFDETPKEIAFKRESNEVFRKNLLSQKSIFEINQYFIGYFILQIKAYYCVSIWKIEKLLSSLIRCANINEIMSTTVLSRSILEGSVTFTRFCNELTRLKHLSDSSLDLNKNILQLDNFIEDIVFKFLFSSKHPALVSMNEALYEKNKLDEIKFSEPVNILTNIKWLDKKTKKANVQVFEFMQIYNYLSDLVHSNYTSNLNFYSYTGDNSLVEYKYNTRNHDIDIFFMITAIRLSLGHLESNAKIFKKAISGLSNKLQMKDL